MEMGIWAIIGTIILAGFVLELSKLLFSWSRTFAKAVALAPGKGIYKVWNVIKARKLIKLNNKLNKLVMKEDYKARLNTALQNPSYREADAVKKVTNKIEAIELKKSK